MSKLVIFDLDQTLVNTSKLEALRRQRNWSEVYRSFHFTMVYEGIHELLSELRNLNFALSVVTSSPASYAEKLLQYHRIRIDNIIGFHDTLRKKPHPDPILKSIEKAGLNEHYIAYGLGDNNKDIQAYLAAGIKPVACMWGWSDLNNPIHEKLSIQSPLDLINIL